MGYKYAVHDVLAYVAELNGPKSYLEIGCAAGNSLEVVLNHSTPECLYLCDLWGDVWINGPERLSNHTHLEELLARVTYTGQVHFLDGSSHDWLPKLIKRRLQFDLILVDGDHSDIGAEQDLIDAWQLLAVGGTLVFDDIFHTGDHGRPGPIWLLPLFRDFVKVLGSQCESWISDQKTDGAGIIKRVK